MVIPHIKAISQALLTRPPLDAEGASTFSFPLDLHVLGLPPAFNLSHDQTLQFKILFGSMNTDFKTYRYSKVTSNFKAITIPTEW